MLRISLVANPQLSMKLYHISLGGYAYRLCKIGGNGIAGVTEQCFQNGHLKFDGPDNWLLFLQQVDESDKADAVVGSIRQPAIRTTVGTTPEGSEWTTFNIPDPEDFLPQYGYGIKDLVQVPESLEPGDYVLSFRWDCQRTDQVWQTCANIHVIWDDGNK